MDKAHYLPRLERSDGKEIIVTEHFLIGRSRECSLQLQENAVSRQHALLEVVGQRVILKDLGSHNGTWLNGQKIRTAHELHDGDRLRIGKMECVFRDAVKPAHTEYKQCPKCRQEIQQDWKRCPYCSNILSAHEEFTTTYEESQAYLNGVQERSKSRVKEWVWGIISGVVGIVIVIIGFNRAINLGTQIQPGNYTAFGENFGYILFNISADGTTFTLHNLSFHDFKCGSFMMKEYYYWPAHDNSVKIHNGQFKIKLPVTLPRLSPDRTTDFYFAGEFDSASSSFSGSWEAEINKETCRGEWKTTEVTPNLDNETSIQSTATSRTGVVFGPAEGTLEHNPSNYVTAHCADVSLINFRTTVTFYSPYSVGLNSWDFGIYFRQTGGDRQYRLEMFSDGGWNLVFVGAPPMWSTLRAGYIAGFVNEEGTAYNLELKVQDAEAVFSVNGKIVENLDVSLKQEPGDICIATQNYAGNAIEGYVTRYEDFTVYDRP